MTDLTMSWWERSKRHICKLF